MEILNYQVSDGQSGIRIDRTVTFLYSKAA